VTSLALFVGTWLAVEAAAMTCAEIGVTMWRMR
jgi:hypothetical protein